MYNTIIIKILLEKKKKILMRIAYRDMTLKIIIAYFRITYIKTEVITVGLCQFPQQCH